MNEKLMNTEVKEIPVGAWMLSLGRSFLIQSVFNTERMQNLGFAYSIAPLLGNTSAGPDADGLTGKKKLEGHLEFFNTNPYLASAIVGAVGRLESDGRKAEEIKIFKRALMGPFGALGDSLFWCSLKPVAVLAGVSVAMGGRVFWAVLATLLIYNTLHIWARLWGFYNGVYFGRWMVYRFTRINFARSNALLGLTAVFILAIAAVWGINTGESLGALIGGHYLVAGALAGAIVWLSSEAIGRGMSSETLFYLAGGISLATTLAIGT